MKNGQASTELMVVLAVSLIVLSMIVFVYYNTSAERDSRFRASQVRIALSEIAGAAENVYIQGAGARTTVFVTFPKGMESVSVSGNTILIRLHTRSGVEDIYENLDFNMTGSISEEDGSRWVRLESAEGYVQITEI